MTRLGDLDLDAHLADPALKPRFVTPMFDLVAPRYDDFTRLFSFGMDRTWKKLLIALALEHAGPVATAVDLACGTGDLAFAIATGRPDARVTGVDASREMLHLAAPRAAEFNGRVNFECADLGAISAASRSVDLVTAGYAFRNGPPLADALRESARVIRPGGLLATLDFYRPSNVVWRNLFLGYLRTAGNLVGWWWHREPVAYGYIASSINAFVTADEFDSALRGEGFEQVVRRDFLGGGIAVHIARRVA